VFRRLRRDGALLDQFLVSVPILFLLGPVGARGLHIGRGLLFVGLRDLQGRLGPRQADLIVARVHLRQ
jgi:hypothetical protein